MAPLNYELGALRNQAVGFVSELERGATERLAKRKEEIEKEGDVYAPRMERIKAREAAIGKEKESNTGLAFLEAGLAMMSTSGTLGQAVGAGGRAGLRSYSAGLDKLRAAQEKLEEAKDRTEELRLNRSDMNKREIRDLERDRDNAFLKGKELMYGFSKDVFGYNRQDTNALISRAFEGQKAVFEQGGRERVAEIGARAARQPAAQVQIAERIMQENNSTRGAPKMTFAEALQQAVGMQREPMTREKALVEWMKPGAQQMIQAQYPNIKSFEDYWTVLSGATGPAPMGGTKGAGGAGDGFRVVNVRPGP